MRRWENEKKLCYSTEESIIFMGRAWHRGRLFQIPKLPVLKLLYCVGIICLQNVYTISVTLTLTTSVRVRVNTYAAQHGARHRGWV